VVRIQFHRKREGTSAWVLLYKGDEIPDQLILISWACGLRGGALVVVSGGLFSFEKFLKANLYLGDRNYLSDLANNYSYFQGNIFKNTKDALLISDSCGSNAIKVLQLFLHLGIVMFHSLVVQFLILFLILIRII